MNQEQERKQLLCLLRGVSLEDLQDPGCGLLIKEGKIISPFLLDVLTSLTDGIFCDSFLTQIVKSELH